jgi:hypothetical protein
VGTVGARARVAKGAYVTGELTGSYQKPSQIVTFWGECVCHSSTCTVLISNNFMKAQIWWMKQKSHILD